MGVNGKPDHASRNGSGEMHDLIAAYAVDAVDTDDALLVESYLAGSETAVSGEWALRDAGTAYAAAVLPDAVVPVDLRSRVLEAAFRRRPGTTPTPSTAVELHRLETERALMLFDRLADHQWSAMVDPEELAGWSVRDVVIHVLSNESLLAQVLGVTEPVAPETMDSNVPRTEATAARLADAHPSDIVAEYRRFVQAVDERASELSETELEADLLWWGAPMRASTALIVRTFETWTHADDIRRALGLPHVPPSAPDLAAMSTRSIDWVPLMMASIGEIEPSVATIVLTGPGGGTHTAQLGLAVAPADATPRFEVTLDVIDYCRAIANRVAPTGLAFEATGDTELAAQFAGSIGTLAGV